jgi:hypothetical protein
MAAPGERAALTAALMLWARVRVELDEGPRPVRVLAQLLREHCWMVRKMLEGGLQLYVDFCMAHWFKMQEGRPVLFIDCCMAHRFDVAPELCAELRTAMGVLLEAVPLA